MRRSALVRLAAFAVATFVSLPALAFTGTPAWLLSNARLIAGPGIAYKTLGTTAKGALVAVERCSQGWCHIDFEGKLGWVSLTELSFGLEARGPWTGAHFNAKSDNGTACFYTGANFSGDYLCKASGFVMKDFALVGLDDRFQSVKITGDASVLVCRDLNFTSYCETLTKDTPKLSRFLARSVSSVHVF